jgi:hypothetical protein
MNKPIIETVVSIKAEEEPSFNLLVEKAEIKED